jgi:hypothetical protein
MTGNGKRHELRVRADLLIAGARVFVRPVLCSVRMLLLLWWWKCSVDKQSWVGRHVVVLQSVCLRRFFVPMLLFLNIYILFSDD